VIRLAESGAKEGDYTQATVSDSVSPGVIAMGARGPAVRDVQCRLAALGDAFPDLRVDGVFGPVTLEAVRRFQRDHGQAADGIVGPETWRALVEAAYRLGDRLLWHSRVKLRGDDVQELQHRLNQLGFDAGSEDGIFGPLVQAAVEEFQRNVGLEVDGIVGPDTVAILRGLERAHHSGATAASVREREALRRLSGRGLAGLRVMVDPAHGPDDPGATAPSGVTEAEVSWHIATRLAARLAARGVEAVLSRGPNNTPTASERAALANEQGVDLVVSIALNKHPNPAACGSASYYYGGSTYVSEVGCRLAELAQEQMVIAGWRPDCRTHPMTWTILQETRMPVVVVEPGFVTAPHQEQRLVQSTHQDRLAQALTTAVAMLLQHQAAKAS
jgi:N-acetylmuramoyl-L-alanine amidase